MKFDHKFIYKQVLFNSCIVLFFFMLIFNLESCKVTRSRTRIMIFNCAGTAILTDSREGYFNQGLRIHYLSSHTPAKK